MRRSWRLRDRTGWIVIAWLAATGVLTPSVANAQRQPFLQHLATFRGLLFGPYGDEGRRIGEELRQLEAAAAGWVQANRASELRLRSQLAAAPPGGRAAVVASLAALLADSGRLSDALSELDFALGSGVDQAMLHGVRGRLLDALGRHAEAAAAYHRAWQLDPADPVHAYLAFTSGAPRSGTDLNASPDHPLVESSDGGDRPSPFTSLVEAARARGPIPLSAPIPDFTVIPDRASKEPLLAPALYADGFAAAAAGAFDVAVVRFREAIARDPLVVDPAARAEPMARGIELLRAGRMQDAIAPLEAAVARYPESSEAARMLGAASSSIGRDDEAIRQLRRAVELAPIDERSHLALAKALRDAGRLDDATAALRAAAEVLPASGDLQMALARVLERRQQPIEAAQAFERAATTVVIAGKAALLWHVAELYDRHQQFDHVVALLRQRIAADPNDAAFHKSVGLIESRRGHFDAAAAELLITDLLGGADAESLTALGQAHLAAGRLGDAETTLRRSLALQTDQQTAEYALARILQRTGRLAEAKTHFGAFQQIRARAMDEQRGTFEVDTLIAAAARAAEAGDRATAATVWMRIVERMPDQPEFRIAAADALIAADRTGDAVVHLEKAAALGAGSDVYRRLAEAYARLGRRDDSARARQAYERRRQELLTTADP